MINAAGILVGGALGLLLKKVLPARLNRPILTAEGLGIAIMGLLGLLGTMITVEDGGLKSNGELLLIISLVLGTVIGELIDIDAGINKLGKKLESRMKGSGFSEGFVSATMVFCIGAMVIMGPLNDVINNDLTVILFKTLLDAITALMLASTLGYGVLFAAVPVFVLEAAIGLLGNALSGASELALSQVFMVGYAIVICLGINFVFDTKIKTANMIPALFVPILYNLII